MRVLIRDEDPAFECGSYVIVQKYLHDLAGWNALPTETQERIIGRTKVTDIELDDAVKPTSAHQALNTIVEDGVEKKIFRANGIFGRPGHGEFGTYFIGYARIAADHRADAREHVRRAAAGQLRSHSGFQPSRNRLPVFCAVGVVPRQRDTGWNCVGNGRFRPRSERLFT